MLVPTRDYSALIPAICTAVESRNTKKAYTMALSQFFAWYATTAPSDGLCRSTVMAYREYLIERGLSSSSVGVALAAIRKLVDEAAANGWIDDVTAYHLSQVKAPPSRKVRSGRWLTLEQTRKLLAAPGDGNALCRRDTAMLWLLAGCGLREEEATRVTIEQIEEIDGRIVLRDVVGKGNRIRTVPVPHRGYAAIYNWLERGGLTSGPILRRIDFHRPFETIRVDESMTTYSIYLRVKHWGKAVGVDIAPHDLRRTFGGLARNGGAEIGAIQRTYGHASSDTTDKYLGDIQDYSTAPCDLTGL